MTKQKKKEGKEIINISSESSLTFPSCWKSIFFIWRCLSSFFCFCWKCGFGPEETQLTAWDLQHLSSFCACHVVLWSPLTRIEVKKFDPSRNCVLSTFSLLFASPWRKASCWCYCILTITCQIKSYTSLNECSELNRVHYVYREDLVFL